MPVLAVEISAIDDPTKFKLFGIHSNWTWKQVLEEAGKVLKWTNPKEATRLFRVTGAEVEEASLSLVKENERLVVTRGEEFQEQGNLHIALFTIPSIA